MVRGRIRKESWECIKDLEGKKIPKHIAMAVGGCIYFPEIYIYEGLINCRDCPLKYGSKECEEYRETYDAKVINT